MGYVDSRLAFVRCVLGCARLGTEAKPEDSWEWSRELSSGAEEKKRKDREVLFLYLMLSVSKAYVFVKA